MNVGSDKLHRELQRIAAKSRKGEIAWTQPNPSTYSWEPDQGNTVLSIQKAEKTSVKGLRPLLEEYTGPNDVYLFQVRDLGSKSVVLSLSSSERPEFYEILKDLYKSAVDGRDAYAGSLLENILNLKDS